MKLYNFKRLIKKYSVPFTLRTKSGGYIGGKWTQNNSHTDTMCGAIVPIKVSKLYASGGTYTAQDRELYLSEPLSGDLSDFEVVYKGNTYTIEEERNFDDYADVGVYVLKWVSKT